MSEPIFKNWTSDVNANWGKAPLSMEHRLHEHPLFTLEAIEQLIETYPREHYALVHMGAQGSPKQSWREGDIGKLTGKQVIEAIGQGRMWIHLFRIGQVDKRYGKLLDDSSPKSIVILAATKRLRASMASSFPRPTPRFITTSIPPASRCGRSAARNVSTSIRRRPRS